MALIWSETPVHLARLPVSIPPLTSALGSNGINARALVGIVVAATLAELPPAEKIPENFVLARGHFDGSA